MMISEFTLREAFIAERLNTRLGRTALVILLHLAFGIALMLFAVNFNEAVLGDLAPAPNLRSDDDAAIGLLLAIIPLFWLPERLESPSQVFGYLLYLAVYLSFCTVGLQSIQAPMGDLISFIGICCLCCIVLFRMRFYRQAPLQRDGVKPELIVVLCVAGALAVVALAMATIGVDFQPLAIGDVYDLREFRRFQFADEGRWYWGYILPPMNQVLAPVVVCMTLSSRRYFLLPLGILIAYAGYQISSQKDALGSAFICIAAFYAWRTSSKGAYAFSPVRILVTMLALLIGTVAFEYWVDDPSHLLSQLTIGRLFVIPGMITAYWVEFFSSNPYGNFAGSGLLGLLFGREQAYAIPLSYVIGLQYFDNEAVNANVNLWADSFGQFGIAGVIMASGVAVAILRILDRLSLDRHKAFILPACLPLAFSLTNGSVTSVFLTNGLWLLIIIAYFLPRQSGTYA